MARAEFRFAFPKRVRFAEVDAQAVVFNPRYLEYFDIGLVEYFRAAGIYPGAGPRRRAGNARCQGARRIQGTDIAR